MSTSPSGAPAPLRASRWRWAVIAVPILGAAYWLWQGVMPGVVFALGAALTLLLLEPLGIAAVVAMRAPAAVPGSLRIRSAIAAVMTGLVGIWAAALSGSIVGRAVGALVVVLGLAALALAVRPPLRGPWYAGVPASVLAALVVLLLFAAVPKFGGVNTRGYYAQMRVAVSDAANAEEAFRADSGRYTRAPQMYPMGSTIVHVDTGGGGYRAWSEHPSAPGLRCAVFAGPIPEPPAKTPGIPACTPLPDPYPASVGVVWLVALAVNAGWGALVLRRMRAAPPGSGAP